MRKDAGSAKEDRLRSIFRYEPELGLIETEIRNGTFEGDERLLKRRMHNLIGWFAADPKLRSRQYYDAVWCHLSNLMGN